MTLLLLCTSSLLLALFVWFLLNLARGYLVWPKLRPGGDTGDQDLPAISVVVPARNEETNIRACVSALLAQDYPRDRLQIVVVNDHSTDGTGRILQELLQGNEDRLVVVDKDSDDLPEHWTGKNHTCWVGYRRCTGDWLAFVDADVTAGPQTLRTCLRWCLARGAEALSPVPFQQTVSAGERMLLPGIYLLVAGAVRFARVNDPRYANEALASGQMLLFRRDTYETLGGHQRVRSYLVEDLAFAKLLKRDGKVLQFAFADELLSVRMYKSATEVWQGFSKNIGIIMGAQRFVPALLAACKSLALGPGPWLLLALVAWSEGLWSVPGLLAGASVLLQLVLMLVAGVVLRVPPWFLPAFPIAATVHGAMLMVSWWKNKRGVREWKGRLYPCSPQL
jgi:chlorobactene glucosyltransferase